MNINSKLNAWLVAYINSDYLHLVDKELKKYPEFARVKAYIPTLKVLTKTFKGKQEIEDVPLLFNYGFFQVPREYAIYQNYLDKMQQNISCIFSWVKDPAKKIVTDINDMLEAHEIEDHWIPCAVASSAEIAKLVKDSYKLNTYSAEDVERLKPGVLITLRGYPFDNVEAEVIEVNVKKQKVLVNMLFFGEQKKKIEVSFDNVFFTIYHGNRFDDSLTTLASIDQMQEKNTLDKMTFKANKNENP